MLHVSLAAFNRDARVRILQWLSQKGPFIEDDRESELDDLFWYKLFDVTDQGLGESARRIAHGRAARSHSVQGGSQEDFCTKSLRVVHGLLEQPLGEYEVPNTWDTETLVEEAERFAADLEKSSQAEPETWSDLIAHCKNAFSRLVISDACLDSLSSSPFYPTVARRVISLLTILHKLMVEMDDNGQLTSLGEELRQAHFIGANARFSDESDANKSQFRNEMTFVDPIDPAKTIVCFWHGKINEPKFRIHFEWPVADVAAGLKVVYIGPKISKK